MALHQPGSRVGTAVLALDLADADQVVAVPFLPAPLLRRAMHGIASPRRDRLCVREVHGRDSGSIGVPGGLDSEEPLVARREDDGVVRWWWCPGDERHQRTSDP